MWPKIPRISETPILWSIPFTLLIITIVTGLLDLFMPFFSLNIDPSTWLMLIATLVSTIVTSIITEIFTTEKKRVLLSMLVSIVVFSFLYNDVVNVFMSSTVETIEGAMPHPLLGSAVNSVILTLIPGAIAGVIFGGAFCLVPKKMALEKSKMAMPTSVLPQRRLIYERTCDRCGRASPYDAAYCPQCGEELRQREVPPIKYCMFCGSKIDFLGKFCPDCGQGIDQVDKNWKYQSYH